MRVWCYRRKPLLPLACTLSTCTPVFATREQCQRRCNSGLLYSIPSSLMRNLGIVTSLRFYICIYLSLSLSLSQSAGRNTRSFPHPLDSWTDRLTDVAGEWAHGKQTNPAHECQATHAYMHTYIHIYIHTYTHTYIPSLLHWPRESKPSLIETEPMTKDIRI